MTRRGLGVVSSTWGMTMVRDFSTMSIGLSRTVSKALIGFTVFSRTVSSIGRRWSLPTASVMSANGVWNRPGSGVAEGLGVAKGADDAGGSRSGVGVARAGVGDFACCAAAAGGATLLRFRPGAFFTGACSSMSMAMAVSSGSAFSSCPSWSSGSILGCTAGSTAGAVIASGSTSSSLMTFFRGLPRLRVIEPVGVTDWSGSSRLDSALTAVLGSAVALSLATLFRGRLIFRPVEDPDGGVSVCAGGCVVCLLALPTDLRGALLAGTGVKSSSLSSAAGGEGEPLISSSDSSIICLRFAAAARRLGRVDMVGRSGGGTGRKRPEKESDWCNASNKVASCIEETVLSPVGAGCQIEEGR